jgi:drug/metabolite transporter (DMT)-like permease
MMQSGVVLVVLSGMMYGLLGLFGTRLMDENFSVPTLLFWRFLVAAVVLVPVTLKLGTYREWDLRSVWSSLVFGALLYSGSSGFYFFASKFIGTGLSMVIFYTYPALVLLMAWKIDQAQMSKMMLASIAIVVFGISLLGSTDRGAVSDWRGVLSALLAALFYGIYVYGSKKQLKKLSSIDSTLMVCIGSAITFFIVAVLDQSLIFPPTLNASINILGIALVCTSLPILFLLEGLKTLDAGKASIISVLEPVFTVVVGALFLGEQLNSVQVAGVLIVLFGATAVNLDQTQQS